MKAEAESSTNGPEGLELVARDMHIAELDRLTVCTHPAVRGLYTQSSGSTAGVA
jgi:hypothetical protein